MLRLCSACVALIKQINTFRLQCRKSLRILKEVAEKATKRATQDKDPLSQANEVKNEIKEEDDDDEQDFEDAVEVQTVLMTVKDESEKQVVDLNCDECQKVFLTAKAFRIHKNNHRNSSKKKRVICDLCGVSLADKSDIPRHFRNVHRKNDNFSCQFCSKVYSCELYLKGHIKRAHNKYCLYCTRSYPNMTDEEFQSHLANKDLHYKICAICGWKGLYQSSLLTHIQTEQ